MTKSTHPRGGYGWRPQLGDHRDYAYVPHDTLAGKSLPSKFSLRDSPHNGSVLDQGQLGSCVPNSNADMYHFVLGADGQLVILPSRLYIYAKGREMEGTPLSQDSGMQVRDALKVLAAGVPPEADEPYSDANPGPFQQEPSAQANADAAKSHAVSYYSINPDSPGYPLRSCIVEGYPFTFGFSVPALLESDQMANGTDVYLPMPDNNTNTLLNEGHGVECVGYDFTRTTYPNYVFEIKNSWADSWGDGGYFFIDHGYFNGGANALASDLWTIRTAT